MDANPYEPPNTGTERAVPVDTPVFYPRFGLRFRAMLIDSFLLGGAFLFVTVLGTSLSEVSGVGAALFLIWVVCAVLYEPLMVAFTGGTLGHHLKNICVVSEETGAHPTLVAAFARSIAKALLGWVSFLMIIFSDRRQALHDMIANVTVRIKDRSLARSRDLYRAK